MEELYSERYNLIERIVKVRKDAIRNGTWVKTRGKMESVGYLPGGVKVVLLPDITKVVISDGKTELSLNLGVVTPDVEIKLDGEDLITYFRETNIPVHSDEHIAMYPEGGIEIEQDPSIKVKEILERMYQDATPRKKEKIEKALRLYMKFEELSKEEPVQTQSSLDINSRPEER